MAALSHCVRCGAAGVRNRDSRETSSGRVRRKHCVACRHRWSTVEMPLDLAHQVRRAAMQVMAALTEIEQAAALVASLRDRMAPLPAAPEQEEEQSL